MRCLCVLVFGYSYLLCVYAVKPKPGIPVVTVPRSDYTIRKHEPVTLICNYVSHPPARAVKWIRLTRESDDFKYIDSTHYGTKFSGSTVHSPSLTVYNVTEPDEGSYICEVSNAIGTEFGEEINLQIEEGDVPHVSIPKDFYWVKLGKSVTLVCNYDAYPPATSVKWKMMNDTHYMEINVTDNYEKYRGSTVHSPSLTILNTQLSDEASYLCKVTNRFGTESDLPISVMVDEQISNIPVVEVTKDSYSVVEGKSVTLVCNYTTNFPATSVQWVKITDVARTTIDVTSSQDKYEGSTVHSPSLTIKYLQYSDEGIYICEVSNNLGTGSSNMIQLHVVVDAVDVPIVKIARKHYEANIGQVAMIDCTVTSKPRHTTVYWTHDDFNNELIISPGTSSTNSRYRGSTVGFPSLTIFGVTLSDEGIYMCHAENINGEGHSLPVFLDVLDDNQATESSTDTPVTTVGDGVHGSNVGDNNSVIIGIIIGSVGGLVMVIVMAVVIVLVCRRKNTTNARNGTPNAQIHQSQPQNPNRNKPQKVYERTNKSEQHVYTDLMSVAEAQPYKQLKLINATPTRKEHCAQNQRRTRIYQDRTNSESTNNSVGSTFNNGVYLQIQNSQSAGSLGTNTIATNGDGYLEPRKSDPNLGRSLPDIPKN